MRTYGYYVMDFGCADFDIYTAIDTELDPYGGLWGYNKKGPGVQNEIEEVITANSLHSRAALQEAMTSSSEGGGDFPDIYLGAYA